MSVDAGLWIRFVARPKTDEVLSALASAGWELGDPIAFVPVDGEPGDWSYASAADSEQLRIACRVREDRGQMVGFQAVLGDECGSFLIHSEELSYSPGVREKLSDGRTSDVTVYLKHVLLPLRRALPIDSWRWLETA